MFLTFLSMEIHKIKNGNFIWQTVRSVFAQKQRKCHFPIPFGWRDFAGKEKKGLRFLVKSLIWIDYFSEECGEKFINVIFLIGSFPFSPKGLLFLIKKGCSHLALSHHLRGVKQTIYKNLKSSKTDQDIREIY